MLYFKVMMGITFMLAFFVWQGESKAELFDYAYQEVEVERHDFPGVCDRDGELPEEVQTDIYYRQPMDYCETEDDVRYEFEWDNDYLEEMIIFHENNDWEEELREEYQYGTGYQLDEVIREVFINADTEKDGKVDYSFNTYMQEIVFYEWDAADDGWEKIGKHEMDYNELVQELIYYEYNNQDDWEEEFKIELNHENGLLTERIAYEREAGVWQEIAKTGYSYDDGLLGEALYYIYEAGDWESAFVEDFQYQAGSQRVDKVVRTVEDTDMKMEFDFSFDAQDRIASRSTAIVEPDSLPDPLPDPPIELFHEEFEHTDDASSRVLEENYPGIASWQIWQIHGYRKVKAEYKDPDGNNSGTGSVVNPGQPLGLE